MTLPRRGKVRGGLGYNKNGDENTHKNMEISAQIPHEVSTEPPKQTCYPLASLPFPSNIQNASASSLTILNDERGGVHRIFDNNFLTRHYGIDRETITPPSPRNHEQKLPDSTVVRQSAAHKSGRYLFSWVHEERGTCKNKVLGARAKKGKKWCRERDASIYNSVTRAQISRLLTKQTRENRTIHFLRATRRSDPRKHTNKMDTCTRTSTTNNSASPTAHTNHTYFHNFLPLLFRHQKTRSEKGYDKWSSAWARRRLKRSINFLTPLRRPDE